LEITLDAAAPLILRDQVAVKAFMLAFPDDFHDRIGRLVASGELSDDEHDFFLDLLPNKGRVYTRYRAPAADEGDFYHVEVTGLGGVYLVQANEFDDKGYFDSLESAEAWIEGDWEYLRSRRTVRKAFAQPTARKGRPKTARSRRA